MKQLPTEDILQTAKRKAQYGHRDWIYCKFPNGERYAEVKSKASLDVAMQNIIQGGIATSVVCANSGHCMLLNRDIITNMMNQLKYGW